MVCGPGCVSVRWKVRAYPESWLCGGCRPCPASWVLRISCTPRWAGLQVRSWRSEQAAWYSSLWNEAQHGEKMHYCFYFVFPFISCPRAWTVSVSIHVHSCTHIQPSFLLPSCVTPRCTLAHTVLRTRSVDAVVSLLRVARPPFATNPCPFHTKLPVGKTHNFYTTRSWLVFHFILIQFIDHIQMFLLTEFLLEQKGSPIFL